MAEPVESENKEQQKQWGSLNFMMIIIIIMFVVGAAVGIYYGYLPLSERLELLEKDVRSQPNYVPHKVQKDMPATAPAAAPAPAPAGR